MTRLRYFAATVALAAPLIVSPPTLAEEPTKPVGGQGAMSAFAAGAGLVPLDDESLKARGARDSMRSMKQRGIRRVSSPRASLGRAGGAGREIIGGTGPAYVPNTTPTFSIQGSATMMGAPGN